MMRTSGGGGVAAGSLTWSRQRRAARRRGAARGWRWSSRENSWRRGGGPPVQSVTNRPAQLETRNAPSNSLTRRCTNHLVLRGVPRRREMIDALPPTSRLPEPTPSFDRSPSSPEAPMTSPADRVIGRLIADRYRVVALVGSGGMGEVYRAEHVASSRPTALKFMRPALGQDADALARFRREAEQASRISHPNVAAIYDFGDTGDGHVFLAMEFIEGESLADRIAPRGTTPAGRRGADHPRRGGGTGARRTGAGSSIATSSRRTSCSPRVRTGVERDPHAVGTVKLVDFGIARSIMGDIKSPDAAAAGPALTRTGMVLGTPAYASPEQLAGEPLDARSDLYALGLDRVRGAHRPARVRDDQRPRAHRASPARQPACRHRCAAHRRRTVGRRRAARARPRTLLRSGEALRGRDDLRHGVRRGARRRTDDARRVRCEHVRWRERFHTATRRRCRRRTRDAARCCGGSRSGPRCSSAPSMEECDA